MKVRKTIVPIYEIPLQIIVFKDTSKADEYLQEYGITYLGDEDYSFCATIAGLVPVAKDTLQYTIFVCFKDGCPIDRIRINEITHEAGHVTDFVYEKVGALRDPTNPEPERYLDGCIAQLITDHLVDSGVNLLNQKKKRR